MFYAYLYYTFKTIKSYFFFVYPLFSRNVYTRTFIKHVISFVENTHTFRNHLARMYNCARTHQLYTLPKYNRKQYDTFYTEFTNSVYDVYVNQTNNLPSKTLCVLYSLLYLPRNIQYAICEYHPTSLQLYSAIYIYNLSTHSPWFLFPHKNTHTHIV